MYGGKCAKDVNILQFNKFTEKQNIEKKICGLVSLANLPSHSKASHLTC